jgi:hypothetical protein
LIRLEFAFLPVPAEWARERTRIIAAGACALHQRT